LRKALLIVSKWAFFYKKKLCQNPAKNTPKCINEKIKKPPSEHQKGHLLVAMEALQNPISSTL